MKPSILTAFLALVAGMSLAPAVHAQAMLPADVFICMAGLSGLAGAPGGAACTPAQQTFFDELVVYDEEGFDAPATAELRYMYMLMAPGAQSPSNLAIVNGIVDIYYGTP